VIDIAALLIGAGSGFIEGIPARLPTLFSLLWLAQEAKATALTYLDTLAEVDEPYGPEEVAWPVNRKTGEQREYPDQFPVERADDRARNAGGCDDAIPLHHFVAGET
jgi:hypothetical protein